MHRRFHSAIALVSLIFSAYRSMATDWLTWAFALTPVLADPRPELLLRQTATPPRELGRRQTESFLARLAARLSSKRDNSRLVGGLIAA